MTTGTSVAAVTAHHDALRVVQTYTHTQSEPSRKTRNKINNPLETYIYIFYYGILTLIVPKCMRRKN